MNGKVAHFKGESNSVKTSSRSLKARFTLRRDCGRLCGRTALESV
jgi:hypothetical protein